MNRQFFFSWCVLVGVGGGDAFVKYCVHRFPHVVWGNAFFQIQLYENASGPFSAFPLLLSLLVSLCVGSALFFFFLRSTHPREQYAYALLLGGGINNFCERVLAHHTTDYIGFFQRGFFNLSDVAIVSGVLLLCMSWKTFFAHVKTE